MTGVFKIISQSNGWLIIYLDTVIKTVTEMFVLAYEMH